MKSLSPSLRGCRPLALGLGDALLTLTLALGSAAAAQTPPPPRQAETLQSLTQGQVSELVGEAWAVPVAKNGGKPRPLHIGDRVADQEQVQTGSATRLELHF